MMPRPITTPELQYLRSNHQASRLYLAFPASNIVFQARINQTFSTLDSVTNITYDTASGAYGDILPGMTLWIGSAAGLYDLGIARIRKAAAATKLYIGETSDLHLENNKYLTVVDDFLPWPRHGRQKTDTTSYADYDIEYSDQYAHPHPFSNMGTDAVAYFPDSVVSSANPASVTFDASGSFMPDGTAIASHSWSGIGPLSFSIADGYTDHPIFAIEAAGTMEAVDTVTGANGKTTMAFRKIVVYDKNNPPVNQFNLTQMPSGDLSSGGWSFAVRMYNQAAFSDVKDRQQVILFTRDWYGDTGSLTATDIWFDPSFPGIRRVSGAGMDIFPTGATIRVSGSASNDGIYTVSGGGYPDMFYTSEPVVSEGAGASITITIIDGVTEISLGPIPGRENIICIGWIQKDSLHYDLSGAYVDFTVQGPAYWLDNMTEFILGIEDIDGTSADWSQMHNLSVDKGLAALLYWRSTVPFISDVHLTGDTRALPSLEAAEGSLWQQIKTNAWETILATPACNRYGQLYVFFDPNLTPSSARGSIPVVMTVTENDTELGKFDIERDPNPHTSQIASGGVAYAWGSGGVGSSKMAFSPGRVFKQWGAPSQLDKLLVTDQAQLNSMTALYIAKDNNNFPTVPFYLTQNNRFIDIAPGQFLYTERDASENPRGIDFASNVIPSRVTLSFDAKAGFISCQVQGEAETHEDLVVTGTVPTPAPPDTSTPPIPFPNNPPIPWPVPGSGIKGALVLDGTFDLQYVSPDLSLGSFAVFTKNIGSSFSDTTYFNYDTISNRVYIAKACYYMIVGDGNILLDNGGTPGALSPLNFGMGIVFAGGGGAGINSNVLAIMSPSSNYRSYITCGPLMTNGHVGDYVTVIASTYSLGAVNAGYGTGGVCRLQFLVVG